ncbi:MAG: DUF4381 domain-containing protein [Halioglobus sp.]
MSAPPLPEIFGNYALGDFHEMVPPDGINWLPQTIGWLCLGVALLTLGLYRTWKFLRQWYRDRYRREAAAQLLHVKGDHSALIKELNSLLKRTALVAYPRERVARLSGKPWSDFLKQEIDTPAFDDRQLQLLEKGSYQPVKLEPAVAQELQAATLHWINGHRGPQHD